MNTSRFAHCVCSATAARWLCFVLLAVCAVPIIGSPEIELDDWRGPLRGKVIDERGQPVEGAIIYMHSYASPPVAWTGERLRGRLVTKDTKDNYPMFVGAVRSDASGFFVLPLVPWNNDFELLAIGAGRKLMGEMWVNAGAREATLPMKSTVTIRGRAICSDGLPAGGLIFNLQPRMTLPGRSSDVEFMPVQETIKCGAEGEFTAANVCSDLVYQAFWELKQGQNGNYDSGSAMLDPRRLGSGRQVMFTVRRFNKAIIGKVTDENGHSIQGAKIEVLSSNIPDRATRNSQSDREGNFSIARLETGRVYFRVSHPQFRGRLVQAEADTIDCTVKLGARDGDGIVRIRVVDEMGKPVPRAAVRVVNLFRLKDTRKMTSHTQMLNTDAGGCVQYHSSRKLLSPSGQPIEPVRGDRSYLCVECAGFDPAYAMPRDFEDADFMVLMHPTVGYLGGRVVDIDDKPITGGLVKLITVDTDFVNEDGLDYRVFYSKPPTVFTDNQGCFKFEGFGRRSSVRFQIYADGYLSRGAKVAAAELEPPSVFRLEPSYRVTGKVIVKDTGKPIPRGSIHLYADALRWKRTTLDEEGAFTALLDLGEYRVDSFSAPGNSRYVLPDPKMKLKVSRGKENHFIIEMLEELHLIGRVVDPVTGKAFQGRLSISFQPNGNNQATQECTVSPDGRFGLYLRPGTYHALIMVRGETGGERQIAVTKPIIIENGKKYTNLVVEAK